MKKKLLSHTFFSFLLAITLCLIMCACAANTSDTTVSVDTQISSVSEETADHIVHSSSQTSKKTENTKKVNSNASKASSKKDKSSSLTSKAISSLQSSEYSESIASILTVISETTKTNTSQINTTTSEGNTNTENTTNSLITENVDTNIHSANDDEPTETNSETNEDYFESENQDEVVSIPERVLPDKGNREKKIIVIDAGHQQYPNFDVEPIAPGSSEMKVKVTAGTTGVVTGIPEYELTLTLALKLQTILEQRNYEVVQTRTTHDVDISNIERADVANNINADAFIRIHANGSDYSSVNGAMALCQTQYNPYNGHIYQECYSLSQNVLDELVASTNCNKQYIWETDTMCGINWSLVPVTIIEVGYMSNPQEDVLMATEDYQDKICVGIANGIDKFFEQQ